MYHIKNDKRSQTTAKALEKGMYECLKTKPLNAITVSDLHRVTGISRATFYRLFDTPEDILYFMCDQYIEEVRYYFTTTEFSNSEDIAKDSFRIFMEKYELQQVLVDNHRHDLLEKIYAENFMHFNPQSAALLDFNGIENEYILPLLYANMSTMFSTWIIRGRKETPEELFQLAKKYGETLIKFTGI